MDSVWVAKSAFGSREVIWLLRMLLERWNGRFSDKSFELQPGDDPGGNGARQEIVDSVMNGSSHQISRSIHKYRPQVQRF